VGTGPGATGQVLARDSVVWQDQGDAAPAFLRDMDVIFAKASGNVSLGTDEQGNLLPNSALVPAARLGC
jgi:hypothetical protein